MAKKSSSSVKVVFANRKKVLRQLKDYAKRIKKTSEDIEKVGLFGSYVNGTYGPASDADILIILRKSKKRFLDRALDYVPKTVSVGCDIFTYTHDEIEHMKKENNPWIRHVLKEVIWLH